jgi:hypothetical protein
MNSHFDKLSVTIKISCATLSSGRFEFENGSPEKEFAERIGRYNE